MNNKMKKENIIPFNIVVFGGDGDLAFRKIYPALFHRWTDGQVDKKFNIYAVTRKENSEEQFFTKLQSFIKEVLPEVLEKDLKSFVKKVILLSIKNNTVEDYVELKTHLDSFSDYQNIFYFSTPSSAFGEISAALKKSDLINKNSKVVLEKPLGSNLKTFNEVNNNVRFAFKENQIYRIDHYLGKETVQNLMVLRFSNHLFEKSWNRDNIDNIQITVAESIGVESRGDFYDKTGALLDMVQNHLLQLLCLVAMEPPHTLNATQVRNEKLKVLQSLKKHNVNSVENQTVKGQYTRGKINDKQVNSYLEDIEKYNSNIETFVALRAYVDNWRWKDVPFYLRTGKRMTKRYSEIVINFKSVYHNIFPSKEKLSNNKLIIRLQPEERIELVQMTKIPGPGGYRYKPISLKLDYVDSFDERFPDAYERLIMDVIRGNQTLFMSEDELKAAWEWIESITKSWDKTDKQNELYKAGSWGPGDKILIQGDSWVTNK